MDEFLARTDLTAATTSYFLPDALGSTVGLSNAAGSVQTDYMYEPFGGVSVMGGPDSNMFEYTGRENDGTQFYLYRARYYHPTLQRFASEDPIEFWGGDINLYAYAKNNPSTFIDPVGLEVRLCNGPADFGYPLDTIPHFWLKTDLYESGMGEAGGNVPGQAGYQNPFATNIPTETVDHSGRSLQPGSFCRTLKGCDEQCINKEIKPGRSLGNWSLRNSCQSYAYDVIRRCCFK